MQLRSQSLNALHPVLNNSYANKKMLFFNFLINLNLVKSGLMLVLMAWILICKKVSMIGHNIKVWLHQKHTFFCLETPILLCCVQL